MLWKKAVLFVFFINILAPNTLLAQFGVGYLPQENIVERELRLDNSWIRLSSPIAERDLSIIETSFSGSGMMFVASSSNLYLTTDNGTSWERILTLPKGEDGFNAVLLSPIDGETLYAATSSGLFRTTDLGLHWCNLFRGIGNKGNNVRAVFINSFNENELLVGSERGLFRTNDGGETWTKYRGKLGQDAIVAIGSDYMLSNSLWVATPSKIYHSDDFGKTFTLSFSTSLTNTEETGISEKDMLNEDHIHTESITKIAVVPYPEPLVYVATTNGIFEGCGTPPDWRKLPSHGLRSTYVEDIVVSKRSGKVFIATEKGAYAYNHSGERWLELHNGIPVNDIRGLALLEKETKTLIAATEEGLFQLNIEDPGFQTAPIEIPHIKEKLDHLRIVFKKEPTVGELQRAAVRYAHVDNKKITWWHIASRLRALVPSVAIDRNRTISTNIDVDRGGSKDRDIYIAGPNDTHWYKNFELKWDLADLIWSSSQTSIDSREKMMVELRDEILSDVTRLYFERRRLLVILILEHQENIKDYLDLRLRIDELTAHLDALTGGYLSEELKEKEIDYEG